MQDGATMGSRMAGVWGTEPLIGVRVVLVEHRIVTVLQRKQPVLASMRAVAADCCVRKSLLITC